MRQRRDELRPVRCPPPGHVVVPGPDRDRAGVIERPDGVADPIGGVLASRQSLQQYVMMQAGRCYTIIGIGGQGVSDVDLALYNPNGKRVASDNGFDQTPMIRHCAQWPGAYRLEATVKRGSGEIAPPVTRSVRG